MSLLFEGLEAGLDIDDFAPRLSFFWGIGMNFYMVRCICNMLYLWMTFLDVFLIGNCQNACSSSFVGESYEAKVSTEESKVPPSQSSLSDIWMVAD